MGVQANVQPANNNEEIIEDEQLEQQPKGGERPAGVAEGSADGATQSEVAALYKDLGIKAPVPTGATKGRPKASDVRAKKSEENGAGSADSKRQTAENADDKNQPKNARSANDNGDSGNKADPKGSKNGSDDEQLQDESGDSDQGVRGAKSRGEGDSERGREEDAERGAGGAGQEAHDEGDSEEEAGANAEAGKRPGKSNPAVEQRFQKLTTDLKERDAEIERLNQELQKTAQEKARARVSESDPEYKIEDFKMVRDNKTGEIKELTDEQAELAYYRWKQGYDQRAEERNAEVNRQAGLVQREQEITNRIMSESIQAYDTVASLMDEYPELVKSSGKFDEDFAADAMLVINDSIEYMPGTEPGNATGALPIIVGLKVDPRRTLDLLKKANNKKRSLPLNGVHDNVESGSSVAVPHTRSSDPTVAAANDLYKQLGINKRI